MLISLRRRGAVPALTPDPFDRRGYLRSPVTFPTYRLGQPPANKGMRLRPEPLTPDELHAILIACGTGPAGNRNRAMIVIGARAGLRCAEMLALRVVDVDLDRGRVHVLRGKGDKDRWVHLDPGACAMLRVWTAERARLALAPAAPLFCVITGPTRGRPINAPYVRQLMTNLGQRAGLAKRVHYHGLRHTYASRLLDQGVPMHVIKTMLGHSSVSITERYADHVGPAQAMSVVGAMMQWPDHAAAFQRSQRAPTA